MHRIILCVLAVSSLVVAQEEADSQAENKLSSRWAALTVASVGFRYFGDASNIPGGDSVAQAQHQERLGGEFRFDAEGKYTLTTMFSTGGVFPTSWDVGRYHLYWKQFYLSAKPVHGVELQVGGLGFEPEAFSDVITYSEDGYVTGSRLAIHRPEMLFFDTIATTYGFFGDLQAPGMEDRFRRMGHVNFRQYLVSKRVAKGAVASVEYNDQMGIRTVREGIRLSRLNLKVIDCVRAELYQRTNYIAAQGFNVGAGKTIAHRLSWLAGYGSIDRYFGNLNNDAFLHGNRVYIRGELRMPAGFRMFVLLNHAVDNNYQLENHTHLDAGIIYDLVRGMQKAAID